MYDGTILCVTLIFLCNSSAVDKFLKVAYVSVKLISVTEYQCRHIILFCALNLPHFNFRLRLQCWFFFVRIIIINLSLSTCTFFFLLILFEGPWSALLSLCAMLSLNWVLHLEQNTLMLSAYDGQTGGWLSWICVRVPKLF